MLDPGHGGTSATGGDPGATYQGKKPYEKDLNNALTKILAKKLEALGANIIYTRNPNQEINPSLKARADGANAKNPDLFISIHHDAHYEDHFSIHYSSYRPNIDLSGAYFKDDNGKKHYIIREENGRAYYIENGKEKYNPMNKYIYDETPSLAARKSKSLAYELYNQMLGLNFIGPRANKPVQDHNLAVTRWTNMPSVLIEAGPTAPKMDDANKHNAIAEKIVKALEVFFSN